MLRKFKKKTYKDPDFSLFQNNCSVNLINPKTKVQYQQIDNKKKLK